MEIKSKYDVDINQIFESEEVKIEVCSDRHTVHIIDVDADGDRTIVCFPLELAPRIATAIHTTARLQGEFADRQDCDEIPFGK